MTRILLVVQGMKIGQQAVSSRPNSPVIDRYINTRLRSNANSLDTDDTPFTSSSADVGQRWGGRAEGSRGPGAAPWPDAPGTRGCESFPP